MDTEKKLSILTKQQRTAYTLRTQGLTFQKIADTMGISASMARQHVRNAERRFREYDRFRATQMKNATPVAFPLTRGDLKIILEGLYHTKHNLERTKPMSADSDWLGSFLYKSQSVEDLVRRVETVIFRRPLDRQYWSSEGVGKNADDSGSPGLPADGETEEKT
ncbi:MAG: hypothetical protein LUE11_12725 [Clostridia bacterium]|nr:hypothetical protein [Clostridia bacterium]